MHARVTFAQVQLEKTDEVVQLIRDSVLPAAQQQQGFKGILSLIDRATGKGITITLWETEADMKAGETGYYQEQLAKFAQFFTSAPTREGYEVSVQA